MQTKISLTRTNLIEVALWESEVENSEGLNQKLLREIENERSIDPEGVQRTNRNGWHSKEIGDYRPAMLDIRNYISKAYLQILGEFGWDTERVELAFSMWVNINPPNAYNGIHTHPEAHMSGAYYVKTPESSGDFRAYNVLDVLGLSWESKNEIRILKSLPYNAKAVDIEPYAGMLIMFPAWLPHEVLRNESDEERISIAFNLTPLYKDC